MRNLEIEIDDSGRVSFIIMDILAGLSVSDAQEILDATSTLIHDRAIISVPEHLNRKLELISESPESLKAQNIEFLKNNHVFKEAILSVLKDAIIHRHPICEILQRNLAPESMHNP